MLANFRNDLRYAIRQLVKSPVFTATSILTLALGIGAVTTIFALVNGILLKPLEYSRSQQLVTVREIVPGIDVTAPIEANPRHYLRWKQESTAFSDWALSQPYGATLAANHRDTRAQAAGFVRTSLNLFPLLSVQPVLGRNFVPEEMQAGHNDVAILTYATWQSLFHGDSDVLGKTVSINGLPIRVVGVLPQSFHWPKGGLGYMGTGSKRAIAAFTPLAIDPTQFGRMGDYNYVALARLKPNVSLAQANQQIQTIQQQIVRDLPAADRAALAGYNGPLASVTRLQEAVVGGVSRVLYLLLAGIGAVLLIVCVNLANLQLARAMRRERETAIRIALGADYRQVISHAAAESMVLAAVGGALGILLAFAVLRVATSALASWMPRVQNIHVEWRVLLFAFAATAFCTLLCGIAPVLKMLRAQPEQALRVDQSRTTTSRAASRFRQMLVAIEVLCTVVLLFLAGLTAKSMLHLMTVPRGFSVQHLLTAEVELPYHKYANVTDRAQVDSRLLETLQVMPGIQAATLSSAPMLNGDHWVDGILRPDQGARFGQSTEGNYRWISPGFMNVFNIPIAQGRALSAADLNTRNALISEAAARAVWPGLNPIGRTFSRNGVTQLTVVGVVADTRSRGLNTAPGPMVYLPYTDLPPNEVFFTLRTAASPLVYSHEIARAVAQVEPEAAVTHVRSMDDVVGESVTQPRFTAALLIGFAVAALLLAVIGIFGVLSIAVNERTQEIGIRIALGADRKDVYALVLHQMGMPVYAGLALGGLIAFWAAGLIQALLFQVEPLDWTVAGLTILAIAIAVVVSGWLPARRAASIDPIQALRSE